MKLLQAEESVHSAMRSTTVTTSVDEDHNSVHLAV